MLTLRQKFYYGICRFGTTILLNVVFLVTFWMYNSDTVDLDPMLNGIGNAVGKLVIGLSSFFFGFLSDSLSSSTAKYGRRKLFIWIGAPLLGLSFTMLFIPHFIIPDGSQTVLFLWLLIWNSLFHFFYGFLLTPYQSWLPELTKPEERVGVSAIMNVTNLAGGAVGAGFSLLMAGIIQESGGVVGDAAIILLSFAIIFSVVEIAMFIPALVTIKEKHVATEKKNIWKELKVALKNKNYVVWMISYAILSIGVTLMSALLLDFVHDVLGLNTTLDNLIFAVLMFVAMVIGFYTWSVVSKKRGIKISLIISFCFLLVWMPLTPLVGKIPFIPLAIQGYIFGFFAIFAISAVFLFPYVIIADIADKDEKDTSVNRSGIYTGFKAIPTNIAQAGGFILVGYLLSQGTNFDIKWIGPVVTIFLIIALPIMLLGDYDLFKKKSKEKNQEIDLES
ncbi:MAG: MFS transporter [Candidatus Heimdallarchaeota archaeon]|nr:MFS transporter [Candidatus Heimdallarchaeota archaeon]